MGDVFDQVASQPQSAPAQGDVFDQVTAPDDPRQAVMHPPGIAAPPNPITQGDTTTPEQYQQMTPVQRAELDKTVAGDRSLLDPLVGAIKGAGQTVNTISKGISKVAPGLVRPQDVRSLAEAEEPTNLMQQAGAGIESAGEFELGGALFDSLAHLPMAERILQAGKAMKVVQEHPTLARVVGAALKSGTLGAAVGGAHGGVKGAAEGAVGGAVLGAASETPGAIKELWGSLDGQQIQQELQTGIRGALSDAASEAGVQPAESNIRNSAKATGDAVLDKSKDLYSEIDAATDGQLTNIQSKLKNVNLKLRTTAGTDDAAEELLEAQRDKLESNLEDVFEQAKQNGVEASVVDEAKGSYKKAQALYDLDAQVKASTFGNAKQAAEVVDPKKFTPRIQKLADAGRLQEALGDSASEKLLDTAYKGHEAAGKLAGQTATRSAFKKGVVSAAGKAAIGAGMYEGAKAILGGKK